MIAKLYDIVLLTDGREASIADVLAPGEYIADVDIGDDYETIEVSQERIAKVIRSF